MKKNIIILLGMLFSGIFLYAQEWQQTASAPEGGGVTEIVVRPDNNHIFVTTASFDWPNGDDGGVRRSMDDGDTWENLFDAYNGRTICFGADGNLYASIWPYPAHEGLYCSTDNGDTWDLLTMIAFGNNIFSIAVSTLTNPSTIFAGTREGVWRSLDNGITWAWANEGIPWATWVRDIEVDSAGIVVAATTSGVFSSDDNGDTWEQATGAGIENDTITKIIFDYPFDGKDNTRLLAGSSGGNIYISFSEAKYLSAIIGAVFAEQEMSGICIYYLKSQNKKMHGVSEFPTGAQPGGFSISTDNAVSWDSNNAGLPNSTTPASALSGSSDNEAVKLKLGFFENMNGGALVYRITYDWSTIGVGEHSAKLSSGLRFYKVSPNPFLNQTSIKFTMPESRFVTLSIFDITGKHLKTILSKKLPKGDHKIIWNAEGIDGGIYFIRLETVISSVVQKVIILE